MRVLALDHGTVRIGVAISDELGMIAQPLEFIPAEPYDGFLSRLKQLIAERNVERILVGMPRNMDGTYGPAADKVRGFVDELSKALEIPIQTWDERLTSVQAQRMLREASVKGAKQRKKIDQMAAAILLQSYLDAQPETPTG
jgi:putative Holliday junction resolvase